jgi:hypothetical protein
MVARVRFSLQGETAGASLSASEQLTDEQGRAMVQLRAPLRAGVVRVKASTGEVSAEYTGTVAQGGPASLRLRALYFGVRATPSWEAALLPPDAPCQPSSNAAQPKEQSTLPLSLGVPSSVPLRVRLRSGDQVLGCINTAPLQPGEQREVLVPVNDVAPAGIGALDLRMNLSVTGVNWGKMLEVWQKRFRDAYLGGQNSDVHGAGALLDTMIVLASFQQRPALVQARKAHGWDALLAERFAAQPGPALPLGWLQDARARILAAPGSFEGVTEASAGGPALFLPTRFLDLETTDLSAGAGLSWSLEAKDTLLLNGELRFAPSRLLRRTIERRLAESNEAPLARLQDSTDCEGVGVSLATISSGLDGCEEACLAALCGASLSAMWQRAISTDELTSTTATMSFTASGPAVLGPQLRVEGFSGSWVGQLRDTQSVGLSVAFQGAAQGALLP